MLLLRHYFLTPELHSYSPLMPAVEDLALLFGPLLFTFILCPEYIYVDRMIGLL